MTVKELKELLNLIPNENLEVKVEIQEGDFGTNYSLELVHYDYGKIYLLGGDHHEDGLWECGIKVQDLEEGDI
jgi:hypothetical protein